MMSVVWAGGCLAYPQLACLPRMSHCSYPSSQPTRSTPYISLYPVVSRISFRPVAKRIRACSFGRSAHPFACLSMACNFPLYWQSWTRAISTAKSVKRSRPRSLLKALDGRAPGPMERKIRVRMLNAAKLSKPAVSGTTEDLINLRLSTSLHPSSSSLLLRVPPQAPELIADVGAYQLTLWYVRF